MTNVSWSSRSDFVLLLVQLCLQKPVVMNFVLRLARCTSCGNSSHRCSLLPAGQHTFQHILYAIGVGLFHAPPLTFSANPTQRPTPHHSCYAYMFCLVPSVTLECDAQSFICFVQNSPLAWTLCSYYHWCPVGTLRNGSSSPSALRHEEMVGKGC